MGTKSRENGASAATAESAPDLAEEDLKDRVRTRRKHETGLGWGRVTRFVIRLMMRHPFAVGSLLFITLLLSAVEVASFTLIVPFLEMLTGQGTGSRLSGTPIGVLLPFFEGMSNAEKLRWIGGITFGLALIKGVFLYAMTRVAQYLHIIVGRDLRMTLFDDLMGVELRWINKQRTANLFTLIHSFPTSASRIVDQYMMGFQNFTSFVVIVVALILVDWRLTLLAAAIGLVVVTIAVQLTRLVRALAIDIKESRLKMHSMTLETLQAMKVIHLFGRIPRTRDRFRDQLEELQDNQYAKAKISSLINPLQSLLSAAFVAALLVGATFILPVADPVWLITLATFMFVVTRFQSRSSKFAKRRADIAQEIPAMEEIMDYLQREDKTRLQDGKRPLPTLGQGIRFEDVRFRYDQSEPDVIKGVSFEIPKGKMVALVGSSGAGKSTLIDLLARLYDPDGGRITVDGHDLREYRVTDWRGRIAVVSQDSFLFNDTIRENIRYGRLDATDDEVDEAARQANAYGFIREMPRGFDTEIGDRGVRLSGGQSQRIAIARAILADPDILILDEATSALDTATEAEVQKAIDLVSKDRTIVAIAHRLSTVRKADQIVVLEHGKVVETGRHEELITQRGRYWAYVQLQDLGRRERDTVLQNGLELPADERVAWVEFTLHRDAPNLAQEALKVAGVRAARSRGKRLDVVTETPSRSIPALFRLFAAKRHRVEALELDELAADEDQEVYRWSGNGAGSSAGEPVWLEFYVDGNAERIAEVFSDHRHVKQAVAAGQRVIAVLRHPRRTVPELVREASRRRSPVVAIDPRPVDDVDELPLSLQ